MTICKSPRSVRNHYFYLAACLLVMSGLIQADSDQLKMALIQTEASLKSLDQGDIQGAAAHAEAANSHVDIASRDAIGKALKDLKGCRINLLETQQQAEKNRISKARVSAEKVRSTLRNLAEDK